MIDSHDETTNSGTILIAGRLAGRAQMPTSPIGVFLLYMGGPATLADVKPFLRHLFSDRELIRLPGGSLLQKPFARLISAIRAPRVRRYYAEIGGGSPLGRITARQALLLQEALSAKGDFRVEVAMRYCSPRASQAVEKLKEQEVERCVALTLYPQFSRATTGSSLRDLDRALAAQKVTWPVIQIPDFHNHPLYLNALATKVEEGIHGLHHSPCVVFSAHSLPQRLVNEGDPYADQVRVTVQGVVSRLGLQNWHLGFQSRSGPVRWLQPDVVDLVDQLIATGEKSLLVVPISFVSDHIETLHEIDIRLRHHCLAQGAREFSRAPSLNDEPRFIEALAQMVLTACQKDHASSLSAAEFREWPPPSPSKI